jgi:hypothetical protein
MATTVEVWAGESYAIAREKETEYCVIAGTKCVYETGNETYDASLRRLSWWTMPSLSDRSPS